MVSTSLVEVLQSRAIRHPDRRACIFLEDGVETQVYTYRDLDRKARVIAAALQRQCHPGETALLLFPAGLEFVAAFFGCLYAGVIAVPTYPPTGVRSTARIEAVAQDAAAAVVLTTAGLLERVKRRLPEESPLADLPWLTTEAIFATPVGALVELPVPDSDDLAFLQFTSGSTSAPKGVMVSHGNLMAHMALMDSAFHLPELSTTVCWVPVYHDMGLIGHVLLSAYSGSTLALMSPTAFLQRPYLWLQAISRYRCEASGGPNFAYEICIRRITPEERATLDLSSWRMAVNGAEPIRPETLESFSETFAECGFRAEAHFPSYGLAEATLLVTGGSPGPAPVVVDGRVGCGPVWGGQQVLVVDPESRRALPDGETGEIWMQGPSVARGYWGRPEATERTFLARLESGEGPFLRTGDLGFFRDGQLFVAGRLKDMMIIRGRNLYPQDIERTVEEAHPAIHATCVAAFAVDAEGEEQLVVAAEVNRHAYGKDGLEQEIVAAVRQAVAEEHCVRVHDLLLLRPASIPKTTSGKIQRSACRELYLAAPAKGAS
jgi:acyl-CoA synthetase (AMP-forming)/AMP-acid ligase II